MVLFALSLAVFLSLAAFAVDVSILYAWRLRVERASKAASFSALQYRSSRGWDYFFEATSADADKFESAARRTEMLDFMRAAVANNLRASSAFEDARLSLNGTTYNGTTDSLSITATYNAPTFLIGRLLPLISNTPRQDSYPVSHTDSASLDPAAVALLLDVSGSMNCPNSDCSCRVAGTNTSACDPNQATINDLVAALAQFKSFFNPFHDYIAVIPFNLAAVKSFPIVTGGAMSTFGGPDGSRINAFNASTSRAGLNPQSSTNICDGLIQAIDEFQLIDNIEGGAGAAGGVRARKFTILFSDGAPNAFHGVFSPPVTQTNTAPSGSVQNDWYEYSLEWRSAAGLLYRGPGPLVQASAAAPLFNYAITASSIAPAGAQVCGSTISDSASFQRVLNASATGGTTPPYPGCLGTDGSNVASFSLPGTNGGAGVRAVALDATGTDDNLKLNFARLPYYCAIEASDWIRAQFSAPVFTIGVGPNGADCNDPFENVDNPLVRKDNFLHRLAADPDIFVNPANPAAFAPRFNFESGFAQSSDCNCQAYSGSGTPPPYQCGPQIRAASQYTPIDNRAFSTETLGEYFGTANGNQLSALFSDVARSILLRLGS